MQREPHTIALPAARRLVHPGLPAAPHGAAANARQSAEKQVRPPFPGTRRRRISAARDIELYRQIFALQERGDVGSRRPTDRAAERPRPARLRALSALHAPDRLSREIRGAERLARAVCRSSGCRAGVQPRPAPPARRGGVTARPGARLSRRRRPGAAGAGRERQYRSSIERSPVADALVEDWRNAIGRAGRRRPARRSRSASCAGPRSRRWSIRSRSIWRRWSGRPWLSRRRRCPPSAGRSRDARLPAPGERFRRSTGRRGSAPGASARSGWRPGTSPRSPMPMPSWSCPPSVRGRRSGPRAPIWSTAGRSWSASTCAWRPPGAIFMACSPAPSWPSRSPGTPSRSPSSSGMVQVLLRLSRRAPRHRARPDRRGGAGRAGDPQARRARHARADGGPDRAGQVARSARDSDAPRAEPRSQRWPLRFERAVPGAELAARRTATRSTGRWCSPSCAPNRGSIRAPRARPGRAA